MLKNALITATVAAGTVFAGAAQAETGTMANVQKRGQLVCGVTAGVPGFSVPDDKGNWVGLDVDLCKAVAAAVLGDASKVKFVPLNAKERFTALSSGEIDVLSRVTTWTFTRDTSLGLNFAGVNYYDGQGFMVKTSAGVKSVKELDGATICVQSGTTTELNMADYFRTNKISYTPVVFDTNEQAATAFDTGRCDAFTTDLSQAYGLRTRMQDPKAVVALPQVISKEPLGPVVRQGDDQWFNVVKWVHNAMLNAEELGVNAKNADDMLKNSTNPNVGRLLGKEQGLSKGLGLSDDWALKVIKQVGNYGEAFDRNVGKNSPQNIDRGLNNLWNNGGIMYAPPIR